MYLNFNRDYDLEDFEYQPRALLTKTKLRHYFIIVIAIIKLVLLNESDNFILFFKRKILCLVDAKKG